MENRFYVDPDVDILTNLVSFVGNFAVQGICGRFSPFKAAEDIIKTGKFDFGQMTSFEDITWDTVFAKMKTVEFISVHSEEDGGINDMAFYMDYADLVHDIDASKLVKQFGEKSVEMSGVICLAIWERFKEEILGSLVEGNDISDILERLKEKAPTLIIGAIKDSYTGNLEEIDSDLGTLFDKTQDVFFKMKHDETAYLKMLYASAVKGTEILICNPDYMQLGDRLKSAVKYYASGVSVTVGDKLSSRLNPEDFGKLEKYIPGVIEYIPTLISMVVTCAIIITVDKNPLFIRLTDEFNKVPTITGNIALYRENAIAFEKMAADLAKIDYEGMQQMIAGYNHLINSIESITDPKVLNEKLLAYYKENGKQLPWGNRSIEEHWADKNSRLVFK